MASVYGRLGYNFDANNTGIIELSNNAIEHLNSAPNFLPHEWQVTDLANADTTGYYKNPAANLCISLFENANSIFNATNNVGFPFATNGEKSNLANTANNFLISISGFKSHTDNLTVTSVEDGGVAANQFPYRQSALGYGKFLIYLTFQTDGITNTSPALGSFTSLFINDLLESNNTIIYNDFITLNNSITAGNSSLSGSAVNTIITHIETVNTMVNTRKNHDVQFFQNSAQVLNDFSTVSEFSNMGELDSGLVNNYIGSDKLLTRLNS